MTTKKRQSCCVNLAIESCLTGSLALFAPSEALSHHFGKASTHRAENGRRRETVRKRQREGQRRGGNGL